MGCDSSKSLPDRRGVQNAAGVPQLIQTARNAELRAGADVALIDLAVVADVADDARRPVLGEAELLAVFAFGADEAHDVRLLGFQRVADVLGVDSELLGI